MGKKTLRNINTLALGYASLNYRCLVPCFLVVNAFFCIGEPHVLATIDNGNVTLTRLLDPGFSLFLTGLAILEIGGCLRFAAGFVLNLLGV